MSKIRTMYLKTGHLSRFRTFTVLGFQDWLCFVITAGLLRAGSETLPPLARRSLLGGFQETLSLKTWSQFSSGLDRSMSFGYWWTSQGQIGVSASFATPLQKMLSRPSEFWITLRLGKASSGQICKLECIFCPPSSGRWVPSCGWIPCSGVLAFR